MEKAQYKYEILLLLLLLLLLQLWWQFFQYFVYGDVVYAQTWEVLSLENCIEPPLRLLYQSTKIIVISVCVGFNRWP